MSISREALANATLQLCLALEGDPAETVEYVKVSLHEHDLYWTGGPDPDTASAPSVYNTPPYYTSSGRCLGLPECADNFFVVVGRGTDAPYAHFTARPAEFVCHTYQGLGAAARVSVSGVYAERMEGDPVPACPPVDYPAWGAGVAAEPGPEAVLVLSIAPDPVRDRARVRFVLPEDGPVRLALYDALGREVDVLADGVRAAGSYEATLDAGAFAPGVYVLRLEATGAAAERRLAVVR